MVSLGPSVFFCWVAGGGGVICDSSRRVWALWGHHQPNHHDANGPSRYDDGDGDGDCDDDDGDGELRGD